MVGPLHGALEPFVGPSGLATTNRGEGIFAPCKNGEETDLSELSYVTFWS
jgi:hypothetical protein